MLTFKIYELSWCQLYHPWWHHRLSLWQPMVLPMMTKLASWQLLDFQWTVSSINTFIGNRKVGIRSLLFSGITVSCNIASLSPGDVLWSRVMTICMWSLEWLCSVYMLPGPIQCYLNSIEKPIVEIIDMKDHLIYTFSTLARQHVYVGIAVQRFHNQTWHVANWWELHIYTDYPDPIIIENWQSTIHQPFYGIIMYLNKAIDGYSPWE